MQLTDKQITEFQELWQTKFGEKISREMALELGISLIRLMQIVFKPIKKNN